MTIVILDIFRDLKPDNLLLDEKGLSRIRTFSTFFIELAMGLHITCAKLSLISSLGYKRITINPRVKSY